MPGACIGTNIPVGIISLKDTLSLSGECSENAFYYSWDFGDGSHADGLQVNHIYAKEGVFTITLTTTSKIKPNQIRLPLPFQFKNKYT